jgi:hypothetical protein
VSTIIPAWILGSQITSFVDSSNNEKKVQYTAVLKEQAALLTAMIGKN